MAESDSMAHSSPATTFGTLLPSSVKTEDPNLVSEPLHAVRLVADMSCGSWDRRAR